MNGPRSIFWSNSRRCLHEDIARIQFMLKTECRYTRLFITIDYSPMDRCSSSVTREQRAMKIDCTILRQLPNNLRKHTESNNDTKVWSQFLKSINKGFITEFDWLQDLNPLTYCILFDFTLV